MAHLNLTFDAVRIYKDAKNIFDAKNYGPNPTVMRDVDFMKTGAFCRICTPFIVIFSGLWNNDPQLKDYVTI